MKSETGDREVWEEEFAAAIASLADWPEAEAASRDSARVARTLVRTLRREREPACLFVFAGAMTALPLFLLTGLITGGLAIKPIYYLAAAGGLAVATVPLLLTLAPLPNGRS